MDDQRFLNALDTLVERGSTVPADTGVAMAAWRLDGRALAPSADGFCAHSAVFRGCELVRAAPVPAFVRNGRYPSGALLMTEPGDVMVSVMTSEEHLNRLLLGLAAPYAATLRNHLFRYGADTGTWKITDRRDAQLASNVLKLLVVTCAEKDEDWQTTADALYVAYLSLTVPRTPAARPSDADDAVSCVTAAIAAHPEDVTLDGLAELLSMNASYLSTLVHEKCGRTFTELVREARMERAAELLRETTLPVRRVAELVGYTGTTAFYRAFRRHFGMGPTCFRT